VGTGGNSGGGEIHYGQAPGLQVVKLGTPGVLKLNLGAGTYHWKFVPIAGKTFTDSGTDECH
jgi:acid phosphatase type 7